MLAMSTKNPAAVALGRKGGHARAQKLTPEQRSESARKAVRARWEKMLDSLEAKIDSRPNVKQHKTAKKKRKR
jgi:cytochrome c-type biogenesis protein CcmH/NrfG